MIDSLPSEMISEFISLYDEEADRDTLKNLSLTASRFVEPCQSILFNHIKLESQNPEDDPGQRLLDLLASSPKIMQYVKGLTISDIYKRKRWLLEGGSRWVEALGKLDLQKIETFSIRLAERGVWVELLSPAKETILNICQSPSLVHLSTSRVPIQLLRGCSPALKHLNIRQPEIDRKMDVTHPICRSSPIFLQSLTLSDLDDDIGYFLDEANQVKIDTLQHLRISNLIPNIPQVSRFLHGCRSSLKSFTLGRHRILREDGYFDIDIGQCGRLESLGLYIYVDPFDSVSSIGHLEWAIRVLGNIPPSNMITQLHLTLDIDLWDDPGSHPLFERVAGQLRALARQISVNPQPFSRLREVNVDVQTVDALAMDGMEDFVRDTMLVSPRTRELTIKMVA